MTPEVLPRLPSHVIPVIGCHSEHKPIPLATDHKEWQGGAQCHLVDMLPEQRPPAVGIDVPAQNLSSPLYCHIYASSWH